MNRHKTVMFLISVAGMLWISIMYINEGIPVYTISNKEDSWLNQYSKTKPIFFVITDEKQTKIPFRAACAIESASFHHPHRPVLVASLSPLDGPQIDILATIPNIKFQLLKLEQVFSETPLENWHRNASYKGGVFEVNHLSDAVRLALLYKCGGIYLDTDVFCLQSLDHLHNAIGLQAPSEVNSAVLIFDMRNIYMLKSMEHFANHYNKNQWAAQGPLLLTNVLKDICKIRDLQENINKTDICSDIHVLPVNAFYPIFYDRWKEFFMPESKMKFDSGVYTIHIWNKLSKDTFIKPGNRAILDRIAAAYCPKIYELIREPHYF